MASLAVANADGLEFCLDEFTACRVYGYRTAQVGSRIARIDFDPTVEQFIAELWADAQEMGVVSKNSCRPNHVTLDLCDRAGGHIYIQISDARVYVGLRVMVQDW